MRLYTKQLTRLATHVGEIIGGFPAGDPEALPTIEQMLRRYAEALTPWATVTASKMIEEVNFRDLDMWRAASKEISAGLRREIMLGSTGNIMQSLLDEQVSLIRSIPIEAAKRVHKLTLEGLENGSRFPEIAKKIQESGEVARSRAILIARTEVARTASVLTEARATLAGSTHYMWMTSGDGTVRPDHKKLGGRIFAWDNPPIADEASGERANPGCIFNCRCWAKPILID